MRCGDIHGLRKNGYAERLMRAIKEEHASLTEYGNMADARARIAHFMEDVCQRGRIHSSLGYPTPEEYEARWNREQLNKND